MKKLSLLLVVVLTIGLCNSLTVAADDPMASENSKNKDWDALFGDEDKKGEAKKRRGHGGPRGEGFSGGSRRGGPGGQAFGGGSRGNTVNPQELMTFLQEHEPKLASKLKKLREESPQDMRRQFQQLSQLYGPVVRAMKHDPEMGKLSLSKVHAQLKIKNLVRNSKKSGGSAINKAKLKGHVESLFDTTISEEKLRLEKMESRMKQWGDSEGKARKKGEARKGKGKGKKGEGRKGGKGGKGKKGDARPGEGRKGKGPRHGGRSGGPDGDPKQRLADHKATIQAWEDNKATIVDQQVERLLGSSSKPFPWGRM